MSRLIVVIGLMACALPALAVEAPRKAAAVKPAEPKPKLHCTYETPTGSHFPKKICATDSQRDERRAADQEAMRNTTNNRRAPSQPMGGR